MTPMIDLDDIKRLAEEIGRDEQKSPRPAWDENGRKFDLNRFAKDRLLQFVIPRLTTGSTVTAAPVDLAAPNVDTGAAAGEPNR
jgi:hypothetical protein